ncbi:MAG: hypothetical protein ACFFDP_11745 [Promethearchaeota archaeon]
MSAQEQDENVATGSYNARNLYYKSRCLFFILIVIVFPIILFFVLPFLLVSSSFIGFMQLFYPFFIGLAICLGIFLFIFVIDSHPNWRQAIRRHFLGTVDTSRSTHRQVTQTTPSPTQYGSNEPASWSILKPDWLDSSSTYTNNRIWPTDVLPMATVIQRLPKLESLVDELQELVESSSLQPNTLDDGIREALLIKQEATNQLLASLRKHFSKKSISLNFFLQKRKHLIKTLQNIEASLIEHSKFEQDKTYIHGKIGWLTPPSN